MKVLVPMPDHSLLTFIYEDMHAFIDYREACAIDYSDVCYCLTHKLN